VLGWKIEESQRLPPEPRADHSLIYHVVTFKGVQVVSSEPIVVEQSFPQDIPEFTRESGKAGWEYFIQQRLPSFLNEA